MIFKLVRIDSLEPHKILLDVGTHIIGRGQFLDCDEKKVSRKHGELNVSDDAVILTALHQNPCFVKKSSEDTIILKQNCTEKLGNGDKFGLLPDSYWYELLHCDTSNDMKNDNEDETTEPLQNNEESTEISQQINFDFDDNQNFRERSASPSLLTLENQEASKDNSPSPDRSAIPNSPVKQSASSNSPVKRSVSPNVPVEHSVSPNSPVKRSASPNSPEKRSVSPNSPVKRSVSPDTPVKRCHSPQDTKSDVKKIKTEPEDSEEPNAQAPGNGIKVKTEPNDSENAKPGPSGDQNNASDKDSKVKPPQSPANPGPLRERCMYGASCYRRNPQHKAQFSHPQDPDWGAGDRGQCPYGQACLRRDPRHWRDHTHPPGVQPPGANASRPGKRRKMVQKSDSDEETPSTNLIVTGKRARKTVNRATWSGSEDENDDPFMTDGSDEWEPPSDVTSQSQTQDFSQDW